MQARLAAFFPVGANQSSVLKHTYTSVMKKVHEQVAKFPRVGMGISAAKVMKQGI